MNCSKYGDAFRFVIAGILTTLVNLLVYRVCMNVFPDRNPAVWMEVSNVIAWIVSVLFAYAVCRTFVWKSSDPHILRELTAFVSSRTGTLFLELAGMYLLVTVLHMSDRVIKPLLQVVIAVTNYIAGRWIFGRRK